MPDRAVTAAVQCEANVGLYLGGAVSVGDSLAGSWGCPEPATVTLRAGCVHEHVREKRFCARHGQVQPPTACGCACPAPSSGMTARCARRW